MSHRTVSFWVANRGGRGKAWKVEVHQLNRDVFVPKSLAVLEEKPAGQQPPGPLHTWQLTVPRWWAEKNLGDLLAKLAAGPVQRAAGHFAVRPAEPIRRDGSGGAFAEYADGTGSFVELRGQPVYLKTNQADEPYCARRDAQLSFGEAARLLGLTAAEVSGLELDTHVFTAPDMWTRAMEAMEAEGRRRRPKSATGETDDAERKR